MVERFFLEIATGTIENLSVIDELVAEDYIQHNPEAGQGREGLREFFAHILSLPQSERLDPSKTVQLNVVAEGDLVVRQDIQTDGMLIDIFRVRDGLLVEHWDAYRRAPGAKGIVGL
ncbi:nuclear transport factor 2 family protein [Rhodococcus erythropolis]|uniref:nuclear transport factor 2 family protein n=1 Tax=Rhodococcus erythropolis TaxID=1833 RepID=UPI001FD08E39|nr:nuclear transport factor 2 family protein [Rhodococcus erythropolis]